jgi:hypothetical protein
MYHQLFSGYEAQGVRLEAWVQRFLVVLNIDGWLRGLDPDGLG